MSRKGVRTRKFSEKLCEIEPKIGRELLVWLVLELFACVPAEYEELKANRDPTDSRQFTFHRSRSDGEGTLHWFYITADDSTADTAIFYMDIVHRTYADLM